MTPTQLILTLGLFGLLALLCVGYLVWWVTSDDYRGRRSRLRRPASWHREPSGGYAVIRARHRAEECEGPTKPLPWGGQVRSVPLVEVTKNVVT